MALSTRFLEPNSGPVGRLIRGALVAPAAAYLAFGTGLPVPVRICGGVVMLLSLISALTGHCFLYDVAWWRGRRPPSD